MPRSGSCGIGQASREADPPLAPPADASAARPNTVQFTMLEAMPAPFAVRAYYLEHGKARFI
jgi:hypothetical protein